MPKYRKKPVVVGATQWFKNGDHPADGDERFTSGEYESQPWEGKVVRRFRTPIHVGQSSVCGCCGRLMHNHGWMDTAQNGQPVCPGDWVVTDPNSGDRWPVKPDIFAATYDEVQENPTPQTTQLAAEQTSGYTVVTG